MQPLGHLALFVSSEHHDALVQEVELNAVFDTELRHVASSRWTPGAHDLLHLDEHGCFHLRFKIVLFPLESYQLAVDGIEHEVLQLWLHINYWLRFELTGPSVEYRWAETESVEMALDSGYEVNPGLFELLDELECLYCDSGVSGLLGWVEQLFLVSNSRSFRAFPIVLEL